MSSGSGRLLMHRQANARIRSAQGGEPIRGRQGPQSLCYPHRQQFQTGGVPLGRGNNYSVTANFTIHVAIGGKQQRDAIMSILLSRNVNSRTYTSVAFVDDSLRCKQCFQARRVSVVGLG